MAFRGRDLTPWIEWITTSSDDGDLDADDECGNGSSSSSISSPHSTQPLVPMSISFLTLARELRDIIYRYLLSTKYTKHRITEPPTGSMRDDYVYRLHPLILCTNRQIYREGSHVLYTENMLVRVNTSGVYFIDKISYIRYYGPIVGHTVPALAQTRLAGQFKHHVMEITMIQKYEPDWEREFAPRYYDNSYIIASDDLLRFCWVLMMWGTREEALSRLFLAVSIRQSMEVSTIEEDLSTLSHYDVDSGAYRGPRGDVATPEDKVIVCSNICSNERQDSSKPTSQQIRRLLGPLSCLHSLQEIHIEGPVSQSYKAQFITSMCRPPPSDQDLFDAAHSMYEDARKTYDIGDLPSAVTKMKNTLDTIEDYKDIARYRERNVPSRLDNRKEMQLIIWSNLGWVSLTNRKNRTDICAAFHYVQKIIQNYVGAERDYHKAPVMGHKVAMVFYLWAKVWGAADELREHKVIGRSNYFEEVIGICKEGLRHEPSNELLKQELKRREDEMQYVKDIQMLMCLPIRMSWPDDDSDDD